MTVTQTVYNLNQIPMGRPSIIFNALKYIDQESLLEVTKKKQPYSRESLLPIAELAIQDKAICAVKANVPTKGVLEFVDLDTFPDEFDIFIHKFQSQESEFNVSNMSSLLNRKGPGGDSLKTTIKNFLTNTPWAHSLSISTYKWFLPFFEKFFSSPSQYAKIASYTLFRPMQIQEEIIGLLNLLSQQRPKNILEIGTARGGTLYLFARVSDQAAKIVSVDLQIRDKNLFSTFARNDQTIILLEADSTSLSTIRNIRDFFPDGIDFLFLDGDHSYEGVQLDFENYAPLVNPGGLIAFHDIVPDNETRFGVITGGSSGEVHLFWKEIKSKFQHVEFVKDYAQDGLGIGVLFYQQQQSPYDESASTGNEPT